MHEGWIVFVCVREPQNHKRMLDSLTCLAGKTERKRENGKKQPKRKKKINKNKIKMQKKKQNKKVEARFKATSAIFR
jgi:coenzyme F420-reducing hydrogenase beta subunit